VYSLPKFCGGLAVEMSTGNDEEFKNIVHSQEESARNKRYTARRRRAEKKQEQLELKRKYGFSDEDWYWDD
jgi:ribosomal protein L9